MGYNPTSQESVYEGIDNRPIAQGDAHEATIITNPDSLYDDVDNRISDSLYDDVDNRIPDNLYDDVIIIIGRP